MRVKEKEEIWELTMTKNVFAVAVLLGVLGATEAFAQRQGGRTDGPEGSEVGYGGYAPLEVRRFSLAVDGGASIGLKSMGKGNGAPLYVGGTLSYWMTDWSLLSVHANYAFNTERLMALIGPSFRTDTWPVSFTIGLKAGIAHDVKTRFALSPELGMDMLLAQRFIIGLLGAWDLPIGEGSKPSQLRIGLQLGWRF